MKRNLLWFLIITWSAEIVIFVVLMLFAHQILNQSIFAVITSLWLIAFIFGVILLKRTRITITRAKKPIEWVGSDNIKKYYGSNVSQVNIEDIITIRKAMTIKNICLITIGLAISIIFLILSSLL